MARDQPDSCPGALQLHDAADGPLARIRVPGGRLAPEQLHTLAETADEVGDGTLELTSRANLQLRAISDPDRLTDMLRSAQLLPSSTHDRVRNILASPLSGRLGGIADVRPLLDAFDTALRDDPVLAELPGRVLFGFDDGRGDITSLGPDIGVQALAPDEFALILAGADTGIRIADSQVVAEMLRAATAFSAIREGSWRLHEVPSGVARILGALGANIRPDPALPARSGVAPIGWLTQDDGSVSLGAGVKLGVLQARTALFVAAVERPIVLTPWRSLLITDMDEWTAEQVVRVLAPMGLIFDAESPWLQVSACTGRPGCARSHADVRADAALAVENDELPVLGRQHWAGCERGCGRPGGAAIDVVAGPEGYRIDRGDEA